jgi:hypothetical protein
LIALLVERLCGFMHQDRKPKLPVADDHDRDQPAQRVGPNRNQRNRRRDRAPAMGDQQ